MTDRQLQPFEQIEIDSAEDRLQVFEQQVLQHRGRVSREDAATAPAANSSESPGKNGVNTSPVSQNTMRNRMA